MKLSMITGMSAALFVAALASTGCGKSSKGDGATTTTAAVEAKSGMRGSCNLRKEAGTCSEETDKSDPLNLAKGLCDALKGSWSDGPCPKDNMVGSCVDKDGSTTTYYADGDAPRDLDDAKASCETINEGKFTPAPSAPAKVAAAATASATAAAATKPTTPAPSKGSAKPAKK